MRSPMLWPVVLLVAALPRAGWAQAPPEDPLAAYVFPPELVMKHAQEIGIDGKQKTAIKEAVQAAQSKFIETQWSMQEESQKLARLLQARPVDEGAVLAQADKVMGLERDVKRTHLGLLVRIKNVLTEAQQARLAQLRKSGS